MKRRIYDLGSNQYREKRKSDYKKILGMYFFSLMTLLALPLYVKVVVLPQQAHAQSVGVEKVQPKVAARRPTPTVTPTPTDTPLQDKEIAYIREVFGTHSDDAIAIARCESGLRPDAVNHNDDAVSSTDYGLFQLNDHWQLISNTNFLFDYKINTLMAKKIFDSWGGNFNAWSCARKLNI